MSARPDVLLMINTFSIENKGETHEISAYGLNADENYLKVPHIPLSDGVDFNPEIQGGQVLVNEAFVKKWAGNNLLDRKFIFQKRKAVK